MARTKRKVEEFQEEMDKIAEEFITFRTEHNLSQKLLAEVMGVARRTIQNAEDGKHIPHAETVKKFEELRNKYKTEAKMLAKQA